MELRGEKLYTPQKFIDTQKLSYLKPESPNQVFQCFVGAKTVSFSEGAFCYLSTCCPLKACKNLPETNSKFLLPLKSRAISLKEVIDI